MVMPEPGGATDCVVLVDDDPINLAMLEAGLQCAGFNTLCFESPVEALAHLQAHPEGCEAVLLDRIMPEMDGLELLRELKKSASLKHLPVVLQTAASDPAEVIEGLEAGAYYYLTKPYDPALLLPVVRSAVNELREHRRLTAELGKLARAVRFLEHGVFRARTLDDVRTLAVLLAGAFPDAGRVVTGLSELLVNAVEHGNAGISYEEKSRLLADARWQDAVDASISAPHNMAKQVHIELTRTATEVTVHIRDEGPGFDWQEYLELSPTRAFDSHGRGIALARMLSFDRLEYRGRGNEVVVACVLP
jgi:DNA-binding response OmpR family regulator